MILSFIRGIGGTFFFFPVSAVVVTLAFFFREKKDEILRFQKSRLKILLRTRARAPLFALLEDDDDKKMNFEDLEDDILDELGPIERWDVSAPEQNLGGRPTMMMQRERKKSHCRERFGLDDPRNAEEAMRTSQALVTKAVMETMEMKGDLEKRKRGAIVPIPEEKWPGIEKAASQFEADVMTNSRERGIGKYIDLSATGMRLKYARFGDERNDRTVFILHDTGENGECYYGLAKQVQEKGGFTVYCVDFRGHGDSTYSREGQYNVPSFVADIESFIIELDLYAHPVALVGFGLGAIVAAAFAGEHEHLVAGVTLIESHPRCREDAVAFHRFQSVSFGSLREAVTFEIATIWPDNERRNAKQCAKRMLSKFRKPKSDEVTGVIQPKHGDVRVSHRQQILIRSAIHRGILQNPRKSEMSRLGLPRRTFLVHGRKRSRGRLGRLAPVWRRQEKEENCPWQIHPGRFPLRLRRSAGNSPRLHPSFSPHLRTRHDCRKQRLSHARISKPQAVTEIRDGRRRH